MDIRIWIANNLFKDNKIIPNKLRISFFEKHENKFELILNETSFLPKDVSIPERIYYIVNNLNYTQKCENENCDNKKKFLSFNYGLQKYCCRNCSSKDENNKKIISMKQIKSWSSKSKKDIEDSIEKRKQTCIKKYGVENPVQSLDIKNKISDTLKKAYKEERIQSSFSNPCIQDKCKQTHIKKYGSLFFESEVGKEKIKQSIKNKYGVENVFSSQEIKDKIAQTHIKNLGVDNPQKNKSIRNKTKQTCVDRYGVESSLASKEVRDKGKETLIRKFGVSTPMHSDLIKNKIKQTCQDRYGKDFASQKNISLETLQKINNEEWLKEQHHELKKPTSLISKEIGVSETLISKKMHKLGLEVRRYGFSYAETEIINFIKEQGVENIKLQQWNIVKNKEIDIYLPDYNLAIEYNGLFWHSDEYGKNQSYHLNKTNACKEKNIQLFHIFENEWENENKKDIWKSIITSHINKSEKIHARKCDIQMVSNKQSNIFLSKNHLQGNINSSIRYGLFYQDKLVSLMTFGKSRYSKNEWEIFRFCNKKYTNVIGGASKLFAHFIKNNNPNNIITYSDRRIGEGNVYNNLGFIFEYYSKPNYFYFKPGSLKLYPRIKFQKHKLENLLENFDSSKSEYENMSINGYYKIWDCGNSVYTWKSQ